MKPDSAYAARLHELAEQGGCDGCAQDRKRKLMRKNRPGKKARVLARIKKKVQLQVAIAMLESLLPEEIHIVLHEWCQPRLDSRADVDSSLDRSAS
jgi:hypothetical protein